MKNKGAIFLAALLGAICALGHSVVASATVTAFLSAGATCAGGNSANFVPAGASVQVSLCISTTVEPLCSVTYRFVSNSAGENGAFNLTARAMAPAYNFSNLPTLAVPFAITNPASTATNTTDYGASTPDLLPVAAQSNQLIATLTLAPQSSSTNSSYVIQLDNGFAGVDKDGLCGGGGVNFPEDTAISASFTLNKAAAPAITSAAAATFTVGSPGTHTLTATGTPTPTLGISGTLPTGVSFVAATGVLSGTPALGTVGTYPITLSANNGVGSPATQNFTLTVQKANQAITFGAIADRSFSTSGFVISPAPSATSGLTVALSSSTPSVCSVSVLTVTMLTAGTCTIAANQAGGPNFNAAATVSQSFQINGTVPGAPNIGAATPSNTQASIAFTAPLNNGGNAITSYTATCNPGSITGTNSVSPVVVAGLANGSTYTCSVAASNATGTGASSGPVVFTLGTAPTITSANTTTFTVNTSGTTFTVTANGNPAPTRTVTGTLPGGVTFNSGTGVLSGTPALGSVGSYPLTVGANNGYLPNASQAFTLVVQQSTQSITFSAQPGKTFGVAPFALNPLASASSGLAISYSSNTSSICTVTTTGTVTIVAAGDCTIAANQAGDANYLAAGTQTQTFTIAKANQTISFGAAPTPTYGPAGTFTVSASGGGSGNAVVFSSNTPAVCTLTSGATFNILTAGTCTVAANQAGSGNYNAALEATQAVTIAKTNQTLVFGTAPTPTFSVGGTFAVTVTPGASTSPVVYSSTTPAFCTLASANTFNIVAAGTCVVAANQSGDTNYNAAAQVTQNVVISKASQTITFGTLPNRNFGDAPFTISATASSNLTVSFASITPAVCSTSGTNGTTVTLLAVTPACTIEASQAGSGNFNTAANVSQSFAILDVTPPDTTLLTFPPNPTNSTTATFTFSANEPGTFACSLDGAAFATCSSGVSYSGLTAGNRTFAVRAIDTAGNVDATPATYAWTIDTTAPVIAITSKPAITSANQAAYTIGGTCSDDGRAITAQIGSKSASATCGVPSTGLFTTGAVDVSSDAQGSISLSVTITDAAGNSATFNDSTLKDSVGPTLTIGTLVAINNANKAAYGFSGTCETGGSLVSFSLTRTASANGTATCSGGTYTAGPVDVSALADGTVSISVGQLDSLNNSATTNGSVNKDTANPTVALNALAAVNAANRSAYAISGTCSEAGRNVAVSVVGSATVNASPVPLCTAGAFSTTVDISALADGTLSVSATHTDAAGNSATASTTVNKDTTYVLTVALAGTGTGSVTGTGINCPGDCTESITHGTVVILTAAANTGSTFTGWSGGGCSGTGTCSVTVTAATTVTATFALNTYLLNVSIGGTGTGSVSGNGIACPGDCSETLSHGTVETLTALAGTGSTFSGWSGGGCSGTGTCVVTMTAPTNVTATFTINSYLVTPSAGSNGSISPSTAQSVNHGSTTSFTLSPSAGYTAIVGGTCGGTLVGNTYTTNAITAPCTVAATFTQNAYAVTPTAGANGSISPNSVQTIAHGNTTSFTVSPNTGYTASVGGTCGGTLVGNTYTTNAITAPCTVAATFTINSYTVTSSAGANGSISPAGAQSINHGSTTAFTLSPNSGFVAVAGGSCGGSLTGNTYTTAAITGPCTVNAGFVALVTFNVMLEGAQETPPNAATGVGSGTAIVNTVANTITLNLNFSGLTGAATAAHLHGPGARGVPAGIKVAVGTTSPITDVVSYAEADEADILAGNWYVNVHTAANPGGELRGQLDNNGFAAKTLTVVTAGSGSGTVTGTGITCGADCSETFTHNTVVVLSAGAATGSTFSGWSGGGCSGNGGCSVTMDALKTVTATFTINSYVVISNAGSNGSIAPSGVQNVNHGSVAVFTVTPDTGYSASVSGTCGGSLVGNTYTTAPITGACFVSASFTLNTYTVTPSAGSNGTINPSTPQTVGHGNTTTFTVTPATGYSAAVTGCGGTLTGNSYTTGPVTANCAVSATFTQITFTVTGSAGTNGTVTPASQIVAQGAAAILTVTPGTGYSASVGGTCGGSLSGTTYTTSPVTSACSVSATFTLNTYTVAPSAGANGTLSPGTPQTVSHGSTTSFTVNPAAGYSIGAVNGCAGTLTGNVYTTGAITGNCTVSATFNQITFTVTSSAGTHGTITPASQTIVQGATAALTVAPEAGYTAAIGGTCGGTLSGVNYTTAAVTANCTVTATFTLNTYTVTPSAGSNGSISPSTPQTVSYGNTTSFTLNPVAGYAIGTVTGCAGTLTGNVFTTGAITGNCSVSATFNQITFTVTSSAGTHGTITPASQTIAQGATAALTVTPEAGYTAVISGSCGGTLSGATYTTAAVTANCTVAATFTLNTYTVTPSAGSNGAMSPSTPQTVNHGSTTSFTVTPDSGYNIVGVAGCGGSLSGNTFTTGTVTGNCTVSATFAQNAFTVTATADAHGSITPASQSVTQGASGTFTVTPDPGYTASVSGTCGGSLTGNTYTTSAMTATCTVIASFNQNLTLISAYSRKQHGGVTPFDLPIRLAPDINGSVTVEPRIIGSDGYTIVFKFNGVVTVKGSVSSTTGTVTSSFTGADDTVLVNLTGVTDGQRVTVSLNGVNGASSAHVSLGFLIGDVNSSRAVDDKDLLAIKSQSGRPVDASNFMMDFNLSGYVGAADVSVVKARQGRTLP